MRLLCGILLALSLYTLGYADENDFNRYVIDKESNKLTVEGSLGYFAQQTVEGDIYFLNPQLSLEYAMKKHGFSIRLPYTIALFNNDEAEQTVFHGFEDLVLKYDYSKQIQNVNVLFGGFWGIPLNSYTADEQQELLIIAGSQRHSIGFTVTSMGIKDPIVWDTGFSYRVGLPRKEGEYWSWQPGNILINAGITTLFNEIFGFRIKLYQGFNLLQRKNGAANVMDFSTSTFITPEVLILHDDWYLQFRLDIYAYPMFMPVKAAITYGHILDFHKD